MRIIAHLDMDAFFAAIEERDTPRFRGLPLAVGADPQEGRGRGVVSTANYKARVYGLHSALPISTAWRLSEAAPFSLVRVTNDYALTVPSLFPIFAVESRYRFTSISCGACNSASEGEWQHQA